MGKVVEDGAHVSMIPIRAGLLVQTGSPEEMLDDSVSIAWTCLKFTSLTYFVEPHSYHFKQSRQVPEQFHVLVEGAMSFVAQVAVPTEALDSNLVCSLLGVQRALSSRALTAPSFLMHGL